MGTIIYLCSVKEFDNSYSDVVDFANVISQETWFKRKVITTTEVNAVVDTERVTLTVNLTLNQLKNVDYLFLQDVDTRFIYYFITNKTYKTSEATVLTLELDVWNTYLFKYELLDSFIERCHVDRWASGGVPTLQIIDEGLSCTDHRIYASQDIKEKKGCYVFASTTPLGTLKGGGSPGSGGSGSSSGGSTGGTGGGDVTNGIISRAGFRFIKGYEGFAPYPCYFSGESFRTAGYGITENYQAVYFDRLAPFPCSEETASTVYCDMIIDVFAKGVYNRLIKGGSFNIATFPQHKFDALVSFAMNCGLGNLDDSGIISHIKNGAGDLVITNIMKQYVNSNGKPLQGLIDRRNAESDIYTNGNYKMRPIIYYNSSGKVAGYLTENNGDGFYPTRLGDSTKAKTEREKIVESAKKLVGKPYIYGGNYPPLGTDSGTDCSGLIKWAYNDNGYLISRTTKTQIYEGTRVTVGDPWPGDLVFTDWEDVARTIPSHVVLYSHKDADGNHWCVEAPNPSTPIGMRKLGPSILPSWHVRRLI